MIIRKKKIKQPDLSPDRGGGFGRGVGPTNYDNEISDATEKDGASQDGENQDFDIETINRKK